MKCGLVLAPMLAAIVGTAPSLAQDAPRGANSAASLKIVMLAEHNRERNVRGVAPLVWNEALAAAAERSARLLAIEPDPIAAHGKTVDASGHGENLWVGTRGAYAYSEMTEHWLDERADYIDGPVPEISKTGNWTDVGHYSQIIWHSTRSMGCALVNNAEMDVLVCRYDPAGNIYGRTATMDLAAR